MGVEWIAKEEPVGVGDAPADGALGVGLRFTAPVSVNMGPWQLWYGTLTRVGAPTDEGGGIQGQRWERQWHRYGRPQRMTEQQVRANIEAAVRQNPQLVLGYVSVARNTGMYAAAPAWIYSSRGGWRGANWTEIPTYYSDFRNFQMAAGVNAPTDGTLGQLSDSDVLGLQSMMNTDFRCIGEESRVIAEDGKAGPATCAAAQYLNTKTGTPYNPECAGFGGGAVGSYPASTLCAMAAPPPAPPQPTPPVTPSCPDGQVLDPASNKCIPAPAPPPTGKKKKKGDWALAVLAAAAVVAGAFALG